MMLTSILISFFLNIIKNLLRKISSGIVILLFFILRLYFKTENLFGAQFGELDKCV